MEKTAPIPGRKLHHVLASGEFVVAPGVFGFLVIARTDARTGQGLCEGGRRVGHPGA